MTPQQLIDFITERYNSRRTGWRTMTSSYPPEIQQATAYLGTLDTNESIFSNQQAFFTLISHFYPGLYVKAIEVYKSASRQVAFCNFATGNPFGWLLLVPPVLAGLRYGPAAFIEGGVETFQSACDPVSTRCSQTNGSLETAIDISGSAVAGVFKEILLAQNQFFLDRVNEDNNQISVGHGLLNMPYEKFELLAFAFVNRWGDGIEQIKQYELKSHQSYLSNVVSYHSNIPQNAWQCIQNTIYPLETYQALVGTPFYSTYLSSLLFETRFRLFRPIDIELTMTFFSRTTPDHNTRIFNFLSAFRLSTVLVGGDELMGATIENLMALENESFLTHWSHFQLDRLPPHLKRHDVFIGIIQRANTENPIEAVNGYINQLIRGEENNNVDAGDAQSTHTLSAHASVALSLERLDKRYKLSDQQIASNVLAFGQFESQIQSDNFIHMDEAAHGNNRFSLVAVRSIRRIIIGLLQQYDPIREERTRYPLDKIIALIWEGLQDTAVHHQNNKDAKESLIRNLYECQRKYNNGRSIGRDAPSCASGTINDLTATLDDIHPDVIIVLINKTLVSEISFSFAKKILLAAFEREMAIAPDFMSKVDSEIASAQWNDEEIHALYSKGISEAQEGVENEINQQMQKGKFPAELIAAIWEQATPWLTESITLLHENKCMLEHTKRRYLELNSNNPLSQPIASPVKNDFIKLLNAINTATNTYQASQAQARMRIFKSVDLVKINEFCQILESESYTDVIAWLSDKENSDELGVGIFGRHLKQHFIGDESAFGSPGLDSLLRWVEFSALSASIHYYPLGS